MANTQLRPRRPVRPVGRGEKNNDQIRVRIGAIKSKDSCFNQEISM